MALGHIDHVLRRQVGQQIYYFGSVSSDKIKGITFVPVVEASGRTYVNESAHQGYQRPGSRTRMRAFMRYLDEHPDSVIPPVLLSGREWSFEPHEGTDLFGTLAVNAPAAIIDGQHRVGGFIALLEEKQKVRPIDFIVLVGLSVEAEKQEFITVNNTQKGVPRALTAFLSDEEEARIAWALNEEDDSPFKERIARTGMARNKLFALHSVAKQVRRTFDHGKLMSLSEDDKVEYMIKYWTIISDELTDEWSDIARLDDVESRGRSDFDYKLLELTGLIAWSLMGPEILGRSYVESVGVNWENVRKLVRACGGIDWSKDGQYAGRTGEAGAPLMKQDMERLLPADPEAVAGLDESDA